MVKNMKRILFSAIIAVLLLSSFSLEGPNASERTAPNVVLGIVEDVRGQSIVVNGRYYDISGVPVFTVKGVAISADLIKKGNGVELRIENRVITRVTVDPLNLVK